MFHRFLKSKFSDAQFRYCEQATNFEKDLPLFKTSRRLFLTFVTFSKKPLNFMKIHPFDHCAGYFLLATATDTAAEALGLSALFHFIVAVDAPMHDVRTMQHYSYQKYTHLTTVCRILHFFRKKYKLHPACARMSALLMILVTAHPLVAHAQRSKEK